MNMYQFCIPDDGRQQVGTVSNVTHSMRWNERNNRMLISTFAYYIPHYRIFNMTARGYTYIDTNLEYSEYAFLVIWLFPTDYFSAYDMKFINSRHPIYSVTSLGYATQKYINCSFSDISGAKGNSMRLELGANSEIKNLQYTNYTTQEINSSPVIYMTSLGVSSLSFEEINLENTWFYGTPFIYLLTPPQSLIMNNFNYNQVHVAAGSAIIVANEIKDFEFTNHAFLDSYPINNIDNSAKFFEIVSFNVETIETALLSNFSFKDSQLTFFSIGSITGTPTEKKTLRVEN